MKVEDVLETLRRLAHVDRDDALVARFLRGDGREQRSTRVVAQIRGVRAGLQSDKDSTVGTNHCGLSLRQKSNEVEFDGAMVGVGACSQRGRRDELAHSDQLNLLR